MSAAPRIGQGMDYCHFCHEYVGDLDPQGYEREDGQRGHRDCDAADTAQQARHAAAPTPRSNRRATTSGMPVRGNRIFEVRTLLDGYGVKRATHYYRRNLSAGHRYTGPAPLGSVHGHLTPRA